VEREVVVAPVETTPDPQEEVAMGTGFLTISSVPWAHVQLNGESAGFTPPWKRELPVDNYGIRLETSSGDISEGRVEVKAGEEALFCWDFQLGVGC
jgi:hypothetical protein